MRSMHEDLKVLANGRVTASGTAQATLLEDAANGADTFGYRSVEVFVTVDGNATAYSATAKIDLGLQSRDGTTGNWTDVPQDSMVIKTDDLADGQWGVLNGAHEKIKTYRVGYVGNDRYVRPTYQRTGNPRATVFNTVVIGGHPDRTPTAEDVV